MVAQDDCERHDAVREMITVPDGQPLLYGERNQGALVQLVLNLRHRYPGLRIAGGYSPPFRPETEEERDAIAAEINASGADVVWVGTGQPKQEKWMAEMRERLDVPILASPCSNACAHPAMP